MRGHLVRRGGSYWFRRRVPGTLAGRFGRGEIHRSLNTSSYRSATQPGKLAWLATQTVFDAMATDTSMAARQASLYLDQLLAEPLLASPTADHLVDASLRGDGAITRLLFNETAVDLVMTLPPDQRRRIAEHMSRITDRIEVGVARRGQEHLGGKAVAAEKARDAAQERAEVAERSLAEARAELRMAVRLASVLPASSQPSAEDDANEASPGLPEKTPKAVRKASPKFSRVGDEYLADRTRAGGYSGQTACQVRSTFRLWADLIGDKPVSDYDGRDAGNFRGFLLKLPASHGKGGRVNGVEAIRSADRQEAAEGKPVPRLSMKTVKRHFSAMSQLWVWLSPREHVTRNIFRGFAFPGTKSSRKSRDDWSGADLATLFGSDWFGPGVPADHSNRWLPLIAMFSGLRLEEAARLRPDHDVVEIGGTWAFRIQEHAGPEPWSPKSEAGERVVPVHSVLRELGFLELVDRRRKEGARRLFPELRPTGPDRKLSTEFSRRFGKAKDRMGINRKTVFHSFRHSVRTILGNTDTKDSWIDSLLGHENGSATVGIAVYLKRIGIDNLGTAVEEIRYPDEVLAAVRAAVR